VTEFGDDVATAKPTGTTIKGLNDLADFSAAWRHVSQPATVTPPESRFEPGNQGRSQGGQPAGVNVMIFQ
jgi:hypothetical protein